MTRAYQSLGVASIVGALLIGVSGCQSIFKKKAELAKANTVTAPLPGDPRAMHEFVIDADTDVIGTLQVTRSRPEETLSDIARRFNLGYDEIVRANPGVDPWLPGEREIILPTQFILPNAPREGLVVNLPALRVFYFPKSKAGEPQRVITHPIGIGKIGWSTPEGTTKVTAKRKNPVWTPPDSVRKEHREMGDPLPRRVPPGPDNPLGAYAMTLGWPSYLIHGTNKPYGVGMRSSHGCVRFYPEDIALLFDQIPVGTPVHVVNQPLLVGWHDGAIYVQALPKLEDDKRPTPEGAGALLNTAISDRIWRQARAHANGINDVAVNMDTVAAIVAQQRGVTLPVSKRELSIDQYLALQTRVHNQLPKGATWDGREELLVTAEEYEAARTGKPLPKKAAPLQPKAAQPKAVVQQQAVAERPNAISASGAKAVGSR